MQDEVNTTPVLKRIPWNKGKLTGAKPPLRPKHVWSIRTKLQIEGRTRDLAMFNLAIDTKLRGCNVVAIRVEDVAAGGYTADRATVRPAAVYLYSPDRKAERPAYHLARFSGVVQVDGYPGFNQLGKGSTIQLAACRVGGDVAIPAPHRPGRADYPHPVLHA
jgi:hypothetical protein